MEEIIMSEPNTTPEEELFPETAEPTGTAEETTVSVSKVPTSHPAKYINKTACLLNGVYIAGLVLTVLYLAFQVYLSISSYLQQMAPVGIALLYTFASIMMPLFTMLAVCFAFKFFAEVVEQLAQRNR